MDGVPNMAIAVLAADLIRVTPAVVVPALGLLAMIGMARIAAGTGAKIPNGFICSATAFSAAVTEMNMSSRPTRRKRSATAQADAGRDFGQTRGA